MLINTISALRAMLELLGLSMLGQATLYVLAGPRRDENIIYRFFSLLTGGPRKLMAHLFLNKMPTLLSDFICFLILIILWIFLAWIRNFL